MEIASGHRVDVLLVDNCVMVRQGLSLLVEGEPDLHIAGDASNVNSAKALDVRADVIVFSTDRPDQLFLEDIARARSAFRPAKILVVSVLRNRSGIENIFSSGADGYLLKTATATELFNAIRTVARGETYFRASLMIELGPTSQDRAAVSFVLTAKEERVLHLLALGNTNAEIARAEKVSLRTVEAQRSRIIQKLGVRTRAELFQIARDVGLINESVTQ